MKQSTPLLTDYSLAQSQALCQSLRSQLLGSLSRTGGHLASNLGMVELTVALHQVFDTSRDRLVFDVGHQCYCHKILTGRGDQMETLRQYGGLAGFPKPSESIHDAFIAGHASNSVAVAVGMAQARTLQEEDYSVIALIGDGALTGGLAYEGLAAGGQFQGQLLVILNDNGMSITSNVGGVAEHLSHQRLKPQYLNFRHGYRKFMNLTSVGRKFHRLNHRVKQAIKEMIFPCSLFEQLGFTYYGPVDGHDLPSLIKMLSYAKGQDRPVLIHLRTTKGKDYPPAQENPQLFHGVSPFHQETGCPTGTSGENFSGIFGKTLVKLGAEEQKLCALTAAMSSGTGLEDFAQTFPQRFFDVGIAEGCAVSMGAGLAQQGMIPVFAVYSTFLQRAYDMLLHDVALSHSHMILAVDRAGLVGEDGETHHGVFDVAFLSTVPGLTLLAPASFLELEQMLTWAVTGQKGTVALRYPRGGEGTYVEGYSGNPADCLAQGSHITLVGYGTQVNALLACRDLLADYHITAEVIKLSQISPLDGTLVLSSVEKTGALLVAEDSVSAGSVGERLSHMLAQRGLQAKICLVNSGSSFVTHGKVSLLQESLSLHPQGLVERCLEVLSHGKARGKTAT